jgi:hypothetical protein
MDERQPGDGRADDIPANQCFQVSWCPGIEMILFTSVPVERSLAWQKVIDSADRLTFCARTSTDKINVDKEAVPVRVVFERTPKAFGLSLGCPEKPNHMQKGMVVHPFCQIPMEKFQ